MFYIGFTEAFIITSQQTISFNGTFQSAEELIDWGKRVALAELGPDVNYMLRFSVDHMDNTSE